MQILTVNNYSLNRQSNLNKDKNIHFGNVYVVAVAKKAFTEPLNAKEANVTFIKLLNQAFGEMNMKISNVLTLFGLGKQTNKTLAFMETPSFIKLDKSCKENNIPSIFYLGQKYDLPNMKIKNPDYYSFYVLTKDDKNSAFDLITGVENKKLRKEALSSISAYNPELSLKENLKNLTMELSARCDDLFMSKIKKPEQTFRINDLSELPDAFRQIEV